MNRKDNIEELFSGSFRDYRPEPAPSVWKNIWLKLFMQDFLRFSPGKMNLYYLLLLIAIPAIGFGLFNRNEGGGNEGIETRAQEQISLHEDNHPANESALPDDTKEPEELNEEKTKVKKSGTDKSAEPEKQPVSYADSASEKATIKKIPPKPDSKAKDPSPVLSAEPVSIFIPSAFSGCAPLQVRFRNLSKNAVGYRWDFGDGGQSEEAKPSYIYDQPGTYTVNLTVTASNGQQDSYSRELTVHARPDVNFEVESHGEAAEGDPVYFYNYTTGAAKYLWDFGDGTKSDRKEPVHFYEESKSYDISLRAWSAEGCADSLLVEDALAPEEPDISFPSAFAPNPDGPTGGYYEPGAGNNMVFHPYTDENIVEYNLKIFNRKGNLIFESNDYQTGWDGYYMQELQPQGVYIYKARGRFSNGKNFVRAGDLTLIHRRRY